MADMTEAVPTPPADAPTDANPSDAETARATEAARDASSPAPPVDSESRDDSESPDDSAPPSAEVAAAASIEPPSEPARADAALVAARAEAEWRVIGESVPGASHLRAGIPNQDAILHVRQSSARLPVIVSISDGHGSNKCFRSDRGSRFAVRVGADLLDELINGRRAALPPSEIERSVRESMTTEFVKRWRAAVEADLKREPFREAEFARMIERDGANARRLVEANPYLAYGATSLSFLLTPAYALYLQLGDGEMITVSEQGEIGHPVPEDARLLANETTSLCLDRASADFRLAVHPHGADALPALVLLTTDGYYNSFSTRAGFHQVGSDLLGMLREANGFDTVNRSVKGWLEEATAAGSGDDCTLAIICRMDALKAPATSTGMNATTAAPSNTASPETPSSSSAAPPESGDAGAPTPAAPHEQSSAPKTS